MGMPETDSSHPTSSHLQGFVDNRYGSSEPLSHPEARRKIGEALLSLETAIQTGEGGSLVRQFSDPLTVMGNGLTFTSKGDVKLWETLRQSMEPVTWVTDEIPEEASDRARLFMEELNALREQGLSNYAVEAWFDFVESTLCMPIFMEKYLDAGGVSKPPIMVTETKLSIHQSDDHGDSYRLNPLDTMTKFAHNLTSESDLVVSKRAQELHDVSKGLHKSGFPDNVKYRPMEIGKLMPLIERGLKVRIDTNRVGEEDVSNAAELIIRFLRRNYVSISEDLYKQHLEYLISELTGLDEDGDAQITILRINLGISFQDKKSKFLEEVAGSIQSKLEDQNLTKTWNDFMDSFYYAKDMPPDKVFGNYCIFKGIEALGLQKMVGSGDVVVNFSLTGSPLTVAHQEVVHTARNALPMLRNSGLVPPDFDGKVVVRVEVVDNPNKQPRESLLVRWANIAEAFVGIPNVFVVPISRKDNTYHVNDGSPTFDRIGAVREMLTEDNKIPEAIVRTCGTEKLDDGGVRYGRQELSATVGNMTPHIFIADDMHGDWDGAAERMNGILENFPGSIIVFMPVVDHGTNIREVEDMSRNLYKKSVYQ